MFAAYSHATPHTNPRNEPSCITAWRLFVSRRYAHGSLKSPACSCVSITPHRTVKRESAGLWGRIQGADLTRTIWQRMKAGRQRLGRETAMLVERTHRVIAESRKLLEQRENQLRELEQFLRLTPAMLRSLITQLATSAGRSPRTSNLGSLTPTARTEGALLSAPMKN